MTERNAQIDLFYKIRAKNSKDNFLAGIKRRLGGVVDKVINKDITKREENIKNGKLIDDKDQSEYKFKLMNINSKSHLDKTLSDR